MKRWSVITIRLNQKGISQQALADACGVTRSAIAQVIRGKSKSKRIRQAIADALGKPVESLFK